MAYSFEHLKRLDSSISSADSTVVAALSSIETATSGPSAKDMITFQIAFQRLDVVTQLQSTGVKGLCDSLKAVVRNCGG